MLIYFVFLVSELCLLLLLIATYLNHNGRENYPVHRYLFSFVLIATCMLHGCALFKKYTPPGITFKSEQEKQRAWGHHKKQIQSITAWKVTGRTGIRTDNDAITADMDWQQHDVNYTFILRNPLGQMVMHLSGAPGTSTLLTPNQKPVTGYSGEQLIFKATGRTIPFDALPYWVRGIPLPEIPAATQLNDQGKLAVLEQSGWKVYYNHYVCSGSYTLPSRVRLTRRDISVTLLLSWKNVK